MNGREVGDLENTKPLWLLIWYVKKIYQFISTPHINMTRIFLESQIQAGVTVNDSQYPENRKYYLHSR